MNIWIDLTNSPHVSFFANFIDELKNDHNIVVTCRPLSNTIDLLKLQNFPYKVVGRHYGALSVNKIFGFFIRVSKLLIFLRNKNMDVAISHSSFYSPIVAKCLGIRSVYLNDNEFAEGNRISFVFADKILIPEFMNEEKIRKQWARKDKIMKYPGVKEGIYLWPLLAELASKNGRDKKTIFIRPEPWKAQYYRGKRNFIDHLLLDLKSTFQIVLLPRDLSQKEYYYQSKFDGIKIPEGVISLKEVIEKCDLFIGAGGTMTREIASLGIPTISIYQDELLDVDKFLISKGLMVHIKDINAEFVIDYLNNTKRKNYDSQLMAKGKEAFAMIKEILLTNN